MSGPQFMHMETYAIAVSKVRRKREATRAADDEVIDRKLTVEEICGEAARLPDHCPHLSDTEPPVLLFGVSPDRIPSILSERIAEENRAIRAQKAAMARGARASGPRAIRKDTHTLVTVVTSFPIPWSRIRTEQTDGEGQANRALLDRWVELNLAWTQKVAKERGFEFISGVLHVDEEYPHLHLFGIPEQDRLEARACHPGYVARDAVERAPGESDKALKGRRNKAYKDAMRAFQDGYFEAVGLDAGLLRVGPKRRRLPNGVYKAEKADARARGLASIHVNKLRQQTEDAQQELTDTASLLEATQCEAVAAIIETSDFETDRFRIEKELKSKRSELAALEGLQNTLSAIQLEIERENVAREKAGREREEAEREAARAREEADRLLSANLLRSQEMEAQRLSLEEDKRLFAARRAEFREEIARRENELERSQQELDAVIEGVEAFADGRLIYNPNNDATPFHLVSRGEPDPLLRERLKAAKPRLEPIVKRLHVVLAKRADELARALTSAVQGWASGLLQGVGDPNEDGRPTFHIPETREGDRLLNKISPFRELVAQVISVLPDRGIIDLVTDGLARLRPRLTDVELARAENTEEGLLALGVRKVAERD